MNGFIVFEKYIKFKSLIDGRIYSVWDLSV